MHPYSRLTILAIYRTRGEGNTQPTANFQCSAAALPPQRESTTPKPFGTARIVLRADSSRQSIFFFSNAALGRGRDDCRPSSCCGVPHAHTWLSKSNGMESNRLQGVGVSSCVVCGTYVFDPSSRLTSCINRSGCASKSSGNMPLTVDSNLSAIDPGTPYHLLGEPACR